MFLLISFGSLNFCHIGSLYSFQANSPKIIILEKITLIYLLGATQY